MKTLEGPSTILCIGSGAGSELVGISAAMVHANPVPKTKKQKTTASSSGKSKDKEDKEDKKDEEAIPKESPTQGSEDPALDLKKMDISSSPSEEVTPEEPSTATTKPKKSKANKHLVTIVMQDYVDWSTILEPMETVVRQRMVLGAERLRCETEVGNVLDLSEGLLQRVAKADLITFMFVLNELVPGQEEDDAPGRQDRGCHAYCSSHVGTHFCAKVVDSVGSFSNLKVGERTYMVYMLLDHLKSLETVYQDGATWYRCPPSATYPLNLENMRHFVRIYRKL
ncbi:hypothetical protein BGZ74_003048 [Mortierella antarctica]|nr:hypothetical protein BGZ74_003048 [Mortierella antarctica]